MSSAPVGGTRILNVDNILELEENEVSHENVSVLADISCEI